MWSAILFLVPILAATQAIVGPGPTYPATKGLVWPEPKYQNTTNDYYIVNPAYFGITIQFSHEPCALLEKASRRYSKLVQDMGRLLDQPKSKRHNQRNLLVQQHADTPRMLDRLTVELHGSCEKYPHLDMSERYSLVVNETACVLESSSVWGALRGLETFSQLLYYTDDFTEIRLNSTSIVDHPTYKHRGILLDTSRHYISVQNILFLVRAMAYNKMNVFHWHIVDHESFPYVSRARPELSIRGAFYKSAVYGARDVARVVEFAREHGVRVVPEFDVPDHTRSWGVAYPELLTPCEGGLGPMNPIQDGVYSLLRDLFREVNETFPDQYLHLGGDEVEYDCWSSDSDIRKYMVDHNVTSPVALHQLFMDRMVPNLPADVKLIFWQELMDNGVKLPANSVVQWWKDNNVTALIETLRSGHRLLYSSCWYLDHLTSGGDWEKYYTCDPRKIIVDSRVPDATLLAARVEGGEACMWTESVDDNNVISRIWPRASATAEVLWSSPHHVEDGERSLEAELSVTTLVRRRLEEHTCRMLRRGVSAQPPNRAGYCKY